MYLHKSKDIHILRYQRWFLCDKPFKNSSKQFSPNTRNTQSKRISSERPGITWVTIISVKTTNHRPALTFSSSEAPLSPLETDKLMVSAQYRLDSSIRCPIKENRRQKNPTDNISLIQQQRCSTWQTAEDVFGIYFGPSYFQRRPEMCFLCSRAGNTAERFHNWCPSEKITQNSLDLILGQSQVQRRETVSIPDTRTGWKCFHDNVTSFYKPASAIFF